MSTPCNHHLWRKIEQRPCRDVAGHETHYLLRKRFDPSIREGARERAFEAAEQLFPATEPSLEQVFFSQTDPNWIKNRQVDLLLYAVQKAASQGDDLEQCQPLFDHSPKVLQLLKSTPFAELDLEKLAAQLREDAVPLTEAEAARFKEELQLAKELGLQLVCAAGRHRLVIPSREALLARWERLREERTDLPPVKIWNMPGRASDMEFVKGMLEHDAPHSVGEQEVHDMVDHIYPTLAYIHAAPERYRADKEHWNRLVQPYYETIRDLFDKEGLPSARAQELKVTPHLRLLLEGAIGIWVDLNMAADGGVDQLDPYSAGCAWNQPDYAADFERQHGVPVGDLSEFHRIWASLFRKKLNSV